MPSLAASRAPTRLITTRVLANSVLGGTSTGRLFEEIRTKRALSYGAYSSLAAQRDEGTIVASAQTKNESAAEVAQDPPRPVPPDRRRAARGDRGREPQDVADRQLPALDADQRRLQRPGGERAAARARAGRSAGLSAAGVGGERGRRHRGDGADPEAATTSAWSSSATPPSSSTSCASCGPTSNWSRPTSSTSRRRR